MENLSVLMVGPQSPPLTIISPQNQNLGMVPSPVTSLHCQPTMEDPSLPMVGSQSPPTTIISPQNQNLAMVPSPIANLHCQPTVENPSAPVVGSQSPLTTIIIPQNQNPSMVPSPIVSSQNPFGLVVGLQSPKTTAFNIQQSTFNSHDLAMSQNGVAQHPMEDSPMMQFLNSTSCLDSYNQGGLGDNMSVPFNPSYSFDFSAINFSSVPSLDSGPFFGMDQYWKTNTLGMKLNTSGTFSTQSNSSSPSNFNSFNFQHHGLSLASSPSNFSTPHFNNH